MHPKQTFAGPATGAGISLLLGLLAIYISAQPLFQKLGLSALSFAIVLGMLLGNFRFISLSGPMEKGIHFVQKRFLRAGIVLYGFRISLQEIVGVGPAALLIDLMVIGMTFTLGTYAGIKLFRMDRESAMLNAAGSSICGAAAVIATEGVVQGGSKKTAVAVSTVVLFGTISMFLYPFLYPLAGLTPENFGIYIGSTVHEVAQVVVAGESLGPDVAATAVIVKMTRVMFLAPFLILLGMYLFRSGNRSGSEGAIPKKESIPWFAIGFILVSLFHSSVQIPGPVLSGILFLDTVLLSAAMAALGTGTNYHKLKGVGLRPFLHGLFLFLFLIFFGYGINVGVARLMESGIHSMH